MGLDIGVYKLYKTNEDNTHSEMVLPEKELKKFEGTPLEQYIVPVEREYYCFDKVGITDETHKWFYSSYGNGADYLLFKRKDDGTEVKVMEADIPTEKRIEKGIYYEEIGYQRKGLSPEFYSEWGSENYFATTLKELRMINKKYSIKGEIVNFRKDIIKNFEEGTCIVAFDW